MNFVEAISSCYKKSITFSGRAPRSEFWWFMLFTQIVVALPLAFLAEGVSDIWSLLNLLPSLAVSARRLHDIDKSGWWMFLPALGGVLMLPGLMFSTQLFLIVGAIAVFGLYILLIVWYSTPGTTGHNRFGEDPFQRTDATVFE